MLKLHISPLSSLDLCWSKQTILTPRIAGKSISCYSFRRYSSSRSSRETFNTIIMLACSLNLLYSSVWQLCHSLCIYHWVRWVWLYILSTSGWENLQPPFLWKSLTNPALSALNYKCMTVCVWSGKLSTQSCVIAYILVCVHTYAAQRVHVWQPIWASAAHAILYIYIHVCVPEAPSRLESNDKRRSCSLLPGQTCSFSRNLKGYTLHVS